MKHRNAEVRDPAGFQIVDPRKWLEHCQKYWSTDKQIHLNDGQVTVISRLDSIEIKELETVLPCSHKKIAPGTDNVNVELFKSALLE